MVDNAMGPEAAAIRLAVFDIDGVFTDGRLYFTPDGGEIKTFNVRDGHGVKQLLAAGIEVAIISGRSSVAVERRMQELGVRHVHQGIGDKVAVFEKLREELGVSAEECSFLGDDTQDLSVMQLVGLPAAPADAHPDVLPHARWSTRAGGGQGAVREFCDALLAARAGAER